MRLHTRRVYEQPEASDGRRILVDRLWPRGLSREAAHVDYWARSIAPSDDLRRWYRHEHDKWDEFRRRYFAELDDNPAGLRELRDNLLGPVVTLVFASKEEILNNAGALREYLTKTVDSDVG